MEKTLQINQQTSKSNTKSRDLILSILFDLVGMASFLVPAFAEITDLAWAPLAGLILSRMYKGYAGKVGGIIVFIEELLPGFDFIPTFTLTWLYVYVIKGGKQE
jgi:hypothetical protein